MVKDPRPIADAFVKACKLDVYEYDICIYALLSYYYYRALGAVFIMCHVK